MSVKGRKTEESVSLFTIGILESPSVGKNHFAQWFTELMPPLLPRSSEPDCILIFVSSAINTARCKKLQNEKEDLERRLEEEVRKLRWQQKEELQVLEQRLHEDYSAKMESLQEQHKLQLDLIKSQHLHQVSSSLFDSEKQTISVLSGFR